VHKCLQYQDISIPCNVLPLGWPQEWPKHVERILCLKYTIRLYIYVHGFVLLPSCSKYISPNISYYDCTFVYSVVFGESINQHWLNKSKGWCHSNLICVLNVIVRIWCYGFYTRTEEWEKLKVKFYAEKSWGHFRQILSKFSLLRTVTNLVSCMYK
jgi:hypothetical protein